jgi:TRAP-type mannitol/chloroaromatic compound transport system substrate-binding protein
MPWADAPQGPGESARRLARRFEAMGGGRIRLEVAAGAAGEAAVASGEADFHFGTAHNFAHLHPAFAYFAGLPGTAGLGAHDLAHWIAVGGGQMLWDDLAGPHGWKPLLSGHLGDAPRMWSAEPIARLGDLAGRRLSAPGLGADVARALGADAVVLPSDQAAQALAAGTLFGAETGGALASLASGVARVARHATGQGLNGHGTALCLSVRLPVWERLASADRAILEAAAGQEFQLSLAEARAHERIARQALEVSFGVRFAPWPADAAEAIDRVAEATIAHVAGRDDLAARIDQSYMAFRSAISGSSVPRRVTPIV